MSPGRGDADLPRIPAGRCRLRSRVRKTELWLAYVAYTRTLSDRVTDPEKLRVHGTTHEIPAERFAREALVPVVGIRPYRLERNPVRSVANDCLVSLETNRYSVPWRLVGERVEVAIVEHQVRIFHRGSLVAAHELSTGRYQVIRDPEHFRGIFGRERDRKAKSDSLSVLWPAAAPEVEVRDLAVYEALAAGGGR